MESSTCEPRFENELTVSSHAIARFRERTGAKYSDEKVKRRILRMLSGALELKRYEPSRVIAIMNHGWRDARYFDGRGMIIVVCDHEVKTIYSQSAVSFTRGIKRIK
jgi:hypothetical protein